jgi:hypothetical protein
MAPLKDEDVNEAVSSQKDEAPNEQLNGCTDLGTPISPPSQAEPAYPHVCTPHVTASVEPTALSVMPPSQVTQNMALAPPVFPPHNVPMPYYTPPPLVVYMPHPPYQMTLYPICPVFFPPPVV